MKRNTGMNLALFDLDNTLLAGDSDFEWAQFLIDRGVLDRKTYEARNQQFYDQYKAGTLDIYEFLDFQLRPLSQYPRPVLDAWHAEYMKQRILPMIRDSARALVDKHRGEVRVIITATNSFVTAPIARAFGVEHLIATDPEMRDGAYTGGVSGTPCFREGKIERLEAWLAGRGESIKTVLKSTFYSDSHNDLPLLEQVGYPVAVDPDATLRAQAQARGWPIISLQ
jgi:HAD superfamily hydrolase (TIGR01490 family)